MSNETKQDVFDETLSNLKKMDAQIEGEWGYSQLTMGVGKHGDVESTREIAIAEIRDRYDDALPDDLPTLPRIIGEYLKDSKLAHNGISFLFQVGNHAMSDYRIAFENWAFTGKSFEEYEKGDTFARAWVLGVWKVAETGEIVKLEAEK